jgi:biotin operon repressor
MTQLESHSIQSLSARLGISRAAALSAIASGKLPAVDQITAGARKIYNIKTDSIEQFKTDLVAELQRRLSKVTDPSRLFSATSSALAVMRSESDASAHIITPQELADKLGCSLELGSWLLQKFAERVENGFRVTAAVMSRMIKERSKLNATSPRRASGI